MTGRARHDDGPALAGRNLAELARRLRLSVSSPPWAEGPAWDSRLTAAARCWRRVGAEQGDGGWADLAAGLEALAAVLAESAAPAAETRAHLLRLEEALAGLLARLDAGEDAAALAAAPAWRRLAAAPASAEAGTPGPVVLLVASPFLREILASRLAAAGRPVRAARGPAEVPELLAADPAPALILCDNEEPTAHLRTVRRLLAGAAAPPPLVLVASGTRAGADRARRARAAGADAVWPEPWRPEHLPAPAGLP